MSERNEENNLGRLRYFEPTTLTFNNTPTSDAIVFPYDDYNIAVDLTVFVNDRYSCGLANESNDQVTYEFSTTAGTISFLGGTNGYLTTNFTDVQNLSPDKNTEECLGIESINISYDSWLHPTVVIKFVDVRGATVMQPSEQDYYSEGKRGDSYYLYKSLFTFPYPLFILKVKGFYGKGVTYRLAVSKTDIDFDASSGNFVITVNFIGHMYGLFADVPMTCIAIAPYTTEGDKYWREKVESQDFCFYRYDSNGNEVVQAPMIKFPELAKKIAEVECAQNIINMESESHMTMQSLDRDIEMLSNIIDAYNNVFYNESGFTDTQGKTHIYQGANIDRYAYFDGDSTNSGFSYIYIAGSSENTTLANNEDRIGERITAFVNALDAYDNEFSPDIKLKQYFGGIDRWVQDSDKYFYFSYDPNRRQPDKWDCIHAIHGLDEESSAAMQAFYNNESQASKHSEDLRQFLLWCINHKSYGESMTGFKLYIQNRNGSSRYMQGINMIIRRKTERETQRAEVNERYKKEKESLVEQALGFRPSIKNIFNLAFAHLDTFIHVYYFYLRKIKRQLMGINDGFKREKATYSIGPGFTDTEDAKENSTGIALRGNYLPPFATFYRNYNDENNNIRKEESWPGAEGFLSGNPEKNLEEVKFVYDMLNGSKLYFEEVQDSLKTIGEYRASGTTINLVSSPSVDVRNFIPITVYDIANNGSFKNPYENLARKITSNASMDEIIGELYAVFSLRMFYYVNSTNSKDSREVVDFGRIEAINVYKALGITHSTAFITFVKKFAADANYSDEKGRFIDEITKEENNNIRKSWQIEQLDGQNGPTKKHLFKIGNIPGRTNTQWWSMFLGNVFGATTPIAPAYGVIGGEIGRLYDASIDYLMYDYSNALTYFYNGNVGTFVYYPLCFNGTNGLKDDFSNGRLKETDRYISTINQPIYYGEDGDLVLKKTLPGGTFLLYETKDYVSTLYAEIQAEIEREKNENEGIRNLFDIDGFEVKRGSKTFRRISDDVNGNIKNVVDVIGIAAKNGEEDVSREEDFIALLNNGNGNEMCDVYISKPTYDIFSCPLYWMQTNKYAKAFLYVQSLKLTMSENFGLTTSVNTVVEKISLLREGALYWYIKNYESFITDGDVAPFPYRKVKNINEIEKTQEEHRTYKKPQKDELFMYDKVVAEDNDAVTVTTFAPLPEDSIWGYKKAPTYFLLPSVTVSESRKAYLLKYFEKWVDEDFEPNMPYLEDITIMKTEKVNDVYEQRYSFGYDIELAKFNPVESQRADIAQRVQRFLRKLFLGVCTIFDYYGGFYGQDMAVKVDDFEEGFGAFMDQLNKIYDPIAKATTEEIGKAFSDIDVAAEQDPFKSEDLRLSLYKTLKSLYNKWICGSVKGENSWKINRFSGSKLFNKVNYGTRTESKTVYDGDSGLYELDNFVYMDSLYRDIGYNLRVNLTKLSEWICKYCIPSASLNGTEGIMNYNSKSLYEFLTDVAQDCGGFILAIPQRFMFNNIEDIKTVFTPIPSCQKWDDNSYTYMFLYTYTPSEHLGDTDTRNIDMNGWSPEGDGFSLTNDEIVGKLFDSNDIGYGVPAFGVTFGKGNQSYFKDIKLSTNQYGVTEAGLNATFQIAAKGSETVRQTTLYGQDIYKVYANNSYECTVEMMGDMQIFPPMYFQLNNIPLWKGAYMIKKVTHSIRPGDVKTTIVGVRQNKNMIPFTTGDIISLTNDRIPQDNGSDTQALSVNFEENSTQGTSNRQIEPNRNLNSGTNESDFNPENITKTKPLICITPAHGPNTRKSLEWAWSNNLVSNYIIPKLRTKTFKDGTSYNDNVHMCNVNGANTYESGYSMRETESLINKYGSEYVISVVPHWNGCGGSRICFYYGRAKGCTMYQVRDGNGNLKFDRNGNPVMWYRSDCTTHEFKREDSRRFAAFFRAAGEELLRKVHDGTIKQAPDGMLGKVTYEKDGLFNYMLTPNCTDGAVQQHCACILSENFFADYCVNRVSWDRDGYDALDESGKYQTGRGWLESEEGLNAIADMHVTAIVNYINSLSEENTELDTGTIEEEQS